MNSNPYSNDQFTIAANAMTQKKTQELSALLTIWASCYPVIYTRRAAQAAALIVNALPDLPMPSLLLLGKVALFTNAVCSLTDERIIPYAEFLQVGECWDQIARGEPNAYSEPGDDLGLVLSAIRAELACLPQFAALRDLWGRRLWALLLAIAQDYLDALNLRSRGDESMPRLDEYILSGIHSAGFPFLATTALILLDEPDTQQNLSVLNEMILQSGAAVRLFTDARSYEREMVEGNMNAVAIAHHDLISSSINRTSPERLEHAREIVLHLADQYGLKCCEMAEPAITRSGRFEQMIRGALSHYARLNGTGNGLQYVLPAAKERAMISSR